MFNALLVNKANSWQVQEYLAEMSPNCFFACLEMSWARDTTLLTVIYLVPVHSLVHSLCSDAHNLRTREDMGYHAQPFIDHKAHNYSNVHSKSSTFDVTLYDFTGSTSPH
jgi:hypothetical protein